MLGVPAGKFANRGWSRSAKVRNPEECFRLPADLVIRLKFSIRYEKGHLMPVRILAIFAVLAAVCGTSVKIAVSAQGSVTPAAEWTMTDVEGQKHQPFEDERTKAIVLVFVTTDCPIANYYQPTLSRLAEEYAKQGVRFFLLHADRDTKRAEAAEHAKQFKSKAPVVLDIDQTIAKRVDARVTPEAFLINRDGRTVYRGRINDLYADYGKRRRKPTKHDLKDAVDSLLAGKKIEIPETKAIGCYIPYPKKRK